MGYKFSKPEKTKHVTIRLNENLLAQFNESVNFVREVKGQGNPVTRTQAIQMVIRLYNEYADALKAEISKGEQE